MPELTTIPTAELAELRQRLSRLAAEKAQLQLVALLTDRLSQLPGLERTVAGILQLVMDILGGINVTIFYRVDAALCCLDIHGRSEILATPDDELVRQAFGTGEFVAREGALGQSGLTPEFTRAATWALPLSVGAETVGVLLIEGLLEAGPQIREELRTFLRYASLVLKHEISGESRLRQAFDEVSRANRELQQARDGLERRVALRTEDLAAANQRLQVELEEKVRAATEAKRQFDLAELYFNNSVAAFAILDRDYDFLRVNEAYARGSRRRVEEFPGRNHFDLYPSDARAIFDEVVRTKTRFETLARPFEFPDQPERGITYWDWTLSPVLDDRGEVEYLVFSLYEVTELKRAELALARANRMLRMLSACNQALIRASDEATLLDEVCRIVVEVGGYRMAWVGLAERDAGRSLRPAARVGFDSGFVESAHLGWGDDERGRGPCGTAVRTGKPCVVRNIAADPDFAPWRAAATERGYKSVAGLPLASAGQTLGALGIYSSETDAFDAEELAMLNELAADLAFGLVALRFRVERERDRQALQASEARLKDAQRVAQVGNWELDLEHNALTWSDEVFRIFEVDPRRFGASYDAFLGFVHPDDRGLVDRAYTESVRTRTPYDIVHRLLMPDGRLKYVNERCETHYDEGGRPVRSLGTVQDITERRKAEEALRHSERLTTALNRIAQEFLTEKSETYAEALAVVLELLGSDYGVFGFLSEGGDLVVPSLTRTVWDTCQVAEKSIVFPATTWGATAWGRAIRERRTISTDGPFALPQGHVQIQRFLAVPILFAGEAIGLLAVANKPSAYSEADREVLETVGRAVAPVLRARLERDRKDRERERAEAALRESVLRYREVFENSSEGIFLLEALPGGRFEFVACNPAHERSLGYSSTALSGRSVEEAVPPALASQLTAVYRRCLDSGAPLACEQDLDLPSGRRHFQTVLIPIRNAEGLVYRISGVARDVTEQRLLEEQFRQAQKMEAVGRLAGGVAHDFNNLLGVILGYTDLLLRSTHAADPRRDRLQQIADAGNRAATLTRQLLAFSRKQVLEPTTLDLAALVSGLGKMLPRLLGEDIDLVIQRGARPCLVRADAGQLEQVVVNLAVNARDAMPEGGRLVIETATVDLGQAEARRQEGLEPGTWALLTVHDTGCGMTSETQRRIFEPFFTTKERGKGTGLGLSQVYGVVQQSNGQVVVESMVGQGTTFRIYLPRVEGAAAACGPQAPEQAARGTGTILLVEDDAGLRQLAGELLEGAGYAVLAAADGAEALAVAAGHAGTIDLLLTDVVMPGMNGSDLAQRLGQRRPQTKVLFMSGYTDDTIAKHGVLAPGTLLLPKPFTAATLGAKVREALGAAPAGGESPGATSGRS